MYRKARKNLVNYRYILLQASNDEEELKSPPFHFNWSNDLLHGKNNKAIEGFRESAKALPLDTEIPTPKGFMEIKNIKIGDEVFGIDGIASKVIATSKIFDNQCYKIRFSDGTDIICNENHLWYVYDKKMRKYQVKDTEYIAKTYKGWNHKNGYKERRYKIPICSAVQYPERNLALNPYILGFWLGDGNSDCSIFTIGEEDINHIDQEFKKRGYQLKKLHSADNRYSLTGIRNKFTKYKLLLNKHIPLDYKLSSVSDRLELIRGLIDSDGNVAPKGSKRGTVTFSNTNKRLAYDFLEVVRSLGIKATITEGIPKLYGKECNKCYRVSFKTEYKISTIERKDNTKFLVGERSRYKIIVGVEKEDNVKTKCIAVDSKLNTFLATKDYLVTHNTQYVLRAFPLYCLTFPSNERDYIVIIKNNSTLAYNKLKEIEREYETNQLINANKVKIQEQSAQAFSVDVKDANNKVMNVRIEAYGKGASVRGLSNLDRRPKIVIIDDPQDVEDARSDTVTESDWDWFLSDVCFLGKNSRIFMIGNNLGERCIIERVFNNAEKLDFDVEKVPILNEKGESAWTEKYSIEQIIKEKESYRQLGKLDVWLRERMCESSSIETRIFNPEDYRHFNPALIPKLISGCNIFPTLDPASSTNKESCYRAIVVNAVNADNIWQIVDVPFGRWDSAELIDKIFDVVVKWKAKEFGIEKGIFKQVLEPFIYKEMAKRNIFFNIIPLEHAKIGTKLERIKLLQPRFKAHTIWFPQEAPWLLEMETELAGVTKDAIKSLFIDLVDALAMQEQIAKPPYNIGRDSRMTSLPRESESEYSILTH